MNIRFSKLRVAAVLAATLVLSGCPGVIEQAEEAAEKRVERDTMNAQLSALASAYGAYGEANHKGPASWEDLRQSGGRSDALQELQDKGWTVIWEKRFRDAYVGTHNYIIAYPKDAEQNGGTIVTMDGTIKELTADEFREAIDQQTELDNRAKARKETSPAAHPSPGPASPEPGSAPSVSRGTGQQPAPAPFGSASRSSATSNTVDSPLVGGNRGSLKRKVDRQGRPMIGYRYRTGFWDRQDVVMKFDPLFESENPRASYVEVMAKDGYAVGAIQVDGDDNVNAIRVAFMRIDGERLNTQDSYVSDWIGKPTGRQPQSLNGNGALVLGVHRRSISVLSAVGLVYKAE